MFIRKVLCLSFLTQFYLALVCAQYRYDCDENFCSKNAPPCPASECDEGSRLIKNATQCGCCHICVKQLSKGDNCRIREIGFPKEECGPGLKCDKIKKKCVSVDTSCIQKQTQYDKNKSENHTTIIDRPDCDEFGFYKSMFCITDVLCHCVNKDGKRIFGMGVGTNRYNSNCQCSRDYDNFLTDYRLVERGRVVETGDFLRCLPNGDYDPLQCTDKWCYCMGDNFHIVGTKVEANTSMKDLLCYDKDRHKYDDSMLRSKCWNERNNILSQKKKYEEKNITVIGVDLPECELDGSYTPKRCKKENCYCVKRNGEFYKNIKVRRGTTEANIMDCRCKREREILEDYNKDDNVKQFLKNNICDSKGNYRKEF